jgi:hypothetical protein
MLRKKWRDDPKHTEKVKLDDEEAAQRKKLKEEAAAAAAVKAAKEAEAAAAAAGGATATTTPNPAAVSPAEDSAGRTSVLDISSQWMDQMLEAARARSKKGGQAPEHLHQLFVTKSRVLRSEVWITLTI